MTTQPTPEMEMLAEKVALVLINDDRAAAGLPPVESRDTVPDSDGYVRNALVVIPIILQSDQQQAELLRHAEAMAEALEPFALTAKHDIGTDECDEDRHIHMERHNVADRLTVGDFRRALHAFREYQQGGRSDV